MVSPSTMRITLYCAAGDKEEMSNSSVIRMGTILQSLFMIFQNFEEELTINDPSMKGEVG